jgi:hypothetical protein
MKARLNAVRGNTPIYAASIPGILLWQYAFSDSHLFLSSVGEIRLDATRSRSISIHTAQSPSLVHKNELAFYVGLLFARSTSRRKFSAGNWAKLQGPFAQLELDEDYVRDSAAHYSEVTGEVVTPEQIRAMIRKQVSMCSEREMTANLLFHAETLKTELLLKPWQVLKAPAGAEFVTSDNPVVTFLRLREDLWHPGHGFRKPGVVIAFPLAPTACLTVGVEGPEFQEVDAATVTRMNEIVVRCCDRFVYSKTFSNGIQEMVNAFARTSVPGETAFIGQFPATQQIGEYLRKTMGIQKRTASGGG